VLSLSIHTQVDFRVMQLNTTSRATFLTVVTEQPAALFTSGTVSGVPVGPVETLAVAEVKVLAGPEDQAEPPAPVVHAPTAQPSDTASAQADGLPVMALVIAACGVGALGVISLAVLCWMRRCRAAQSKADSELAPQLAPYFEKQLSKPQAVDAVEVSSRV
jgi:hypothetical protein